MDYFDVSKLSDPTFFMDNRMPARSSHRWYASNDELAIGSSSYFQTLDGLWKFSYAPNLSMAVSGFEGADYDCSGWDDIRVPANIQMEGYDAPQYANVQYPWDGREALQPGDAPRRFNPVASYVKYFELPENWAGMPLFISFQGVESAAAVWLNGSYVGYSEDSFTPSEFELTRFVKPGKNKLAVRVFKWTSGSWCEDQDFFRFSGIFRSVFLYTQPETHICDIKLQTPLADDFKSAKLTGAIIGKGGGSAKAKLSLNGEIVAECDFAIGENCAFSMDVSRPRLWSAEQPVLYTLLLEVYGVDGGLCELIAENVGFRRFEIKDGIMCLNGRRIVFNGVNRHEFSAIGGRVITDDELIKDVVTMKQNNINAIRTSHYPNDVRLYSLCDEYGIYVIDEANLESHGMWDAVVSGKQTLEQLIPGDKPEWRALVLDRANSMYQRDKNHPCVLIWSCGNESMGGTNIRDMAEFFRSIDIRPVHYEGVYHDRRYYKDSTDIASFMYVTAEDVARQLKADRSKPAISCEYAHAMGNSCGAMFEYTRLTEIEPLYQGGFIWDYIDQALTCRDRYGKIYQAYGGDFGDRPCDYAFCGDGIVYSDGRTPSPKMSEVKFNYQPLVIIVKEDCFEVANKNLFTSTEEYDCDVVLARDGMELYRKKVPTCIEPGQKATYKLPFELPKAAGEYAITVSFTLKKDEKWAEIGHEIAFGQGVFKRESVKKACEKPLEVIEGFLNIGVRGEEFDALFSYTAGGLVSYRYGGKELIKNKPMPNFWRAPTDNDKGNLMPARYAQWKTASMYLTHRYNGGYSVHAPRLEKLDGHAKITYHYVLPTIPETFCEVCYDVYGDGSIATTLSYLPDSSIVDMPEFGMLFCLDAAYDNIKWYGDGPDESYWDRHSGAKLGIYTSTASNSMARYLTPQECGNHTGVRWAEVTDARGRGLRFEGDGIFFSALPYTPHQLECAGHPNELPPVHNTIVRAALAQMGVGCENSWGAQTHAEFLIDTSKKLEFTFAFKGI